MNHTIAFARCADEEELRKILTEPGMDLAGDIEDHVLLKEENKILASGMLCQADGNLFHLSVFAVSKTERGKGAGCRLLREFNARPWKYCRGAAEITGGLYRITTVAKGEAVPFYKKCGYQACDFSRLPAPFDRQCEDCPEQKRCNPGPMVFTGIIPGRRRM